MRPCSAALKTFLEGPAKEAVQIDLYTIALVTGETFRWTAGNDALTVPSAGFPSISLNAGAARTFFLGPRFGRSKTSTKVGIEPAQLDIEIYHGAAILGGYTISDIARLGLLDGAVIELDRFFAPPPTGITLDVSLGCIVWFRGNVADVEIGRSTVKVTVKSILNKLATGQFPGRLYAVSCGHVFGGVMCGYDLVAGKNALGASTGIGQATITAASGSDEYEIHASFTPSAPSPYIEGTISCVTGANAGASRTIGDHVSGVAYPKRPFLSPVSIGDTFDLLPGCSHAAAYCKDKLNNAGRFGGFPKVPPPEAAV